MAFAETRLIDIDDVGGYVNISPNISTNKIESLIDRLQRKYLTALFGREMYYDFFDDASTVDYDDLTNGVEYTPGTYSIRYFGLKPYLCYLFLEAYTLYGDFNHGDGGNHLMQDLRYSEKMEYLDKKTLASSYRAMAEDYKAQIINYINDNLTTFTKYYSSETIRPTEPRIVKFTAK